MLPPFAAVLGPIKVLSCLGDLTAGVYVVSHYCSLGFPLLWHMTHVIHICGVSGMTRVLRDSAGCQMP